MPHPLILFNFVTLIIFGEAYRLLCYEAYKVVFKNQMLLRDQMKEDEIGGTCSTHGRMKIA